jgi:D-inositol-3-phosphate glycosyltransferase
MVSANASPLTPPGGGEAGGPNVHVGALAVALARRGHEVTIHTRRDDLGAPDSVPYAHGVTIEHVRAGPARPVTRGELLPYLPEFAERLAGRWSCRPPDVIHAHSWLSGLAALDAFQEGGVPVVQTFHGLVGAGHGHQRHAGMNASERSLIEAQVGLAASAVIATCTDEVGELGTYGVPADTIHVVPNGVDLGLFRTEGPIAERGDRPRVLTIGRLVPRTGVETVIEALCHVPDAELVVAGGPGRTDMEHEPGLLRLRRLAMDRGVAKRVRFAGRVRHEDLPALIRSADAVVSVPSHMPSGLVALEAMACGVPVVVSAVGGHLDTVVDGMTGLHVPPGVPGATAGRLRKLFGDPRLGSALGSAAARRTRERYGWGRIAAETETVYNRVVDGAAPALAADVARP